MFPEKARPTLKIEGGAPCVLFRFAIKEKTWGTLRVIAISFQETSDEAQ